MIRVFTSTCSRDKGYVARLCTQMCKHGIDHFLFVEAAEVGAFSDLPVKEGRLLIKPDGGDNGLGRGGTLVKSACWRQLAELVSDDDTVINLDSDVYFVNESMLDALVCNEFETKGFADTEVKRVGEKTFFHMSGMLIAAHGASFRSVARLTSDEVYRHATDVMDAGMIPSEDVVFSYLLQTVGNATKVVNLHTMFTRNLGKNYDSLDFDVIA